MASLPATVSTPFSGLIARAERGTGRRRAVALGLEVRPRRLADTHHRRHTDPRDHRAGQHRQGDRPQGLTL
ncbi:hypothetical protein NL533_30370, partial [Klebsiella pneumoniae]|nr:hypothetical protein [Klebsiella pneumoniae]